MISNTLRWFLVITTLTLTACSTDFDLTSDWKDITVVYGLLNYTDTAQYVKINKAYLDDKTDALQLAQVEDSVFYNSIDVRMDEVNDAGTVTNSFPLNKVDGNLDGHPKDGGAFLSSPNWLYKLKQPLQQDKSYRLVVNKNDGNAVTAETKLVNDFVVIKPFAGQEINIVPGPISAYTVTWKNAKNAAFYGLTARFWYIEYPTNNPSDSTLKSFEWHVFDDFVPDNNAASATVEYRISGNSFYSELANRIPVDPSVSRSARYMDFTFAAGGNELYTYYLVGQSKLGITSGQISPDYTNVDGGRGVLSSRLFKNISHIPLKQPTVDSIACNKVTQDLRFLNSQGLFCH